MLRAIVFPGQGSQSVGMGRDIYDQFQYVRDLFDRVDSIMGVKLSEIIFKGPRERLVLTQYAQPAIMLVSLALLRVFLDKLSLRDIRDYFACTAGHSLGEYTALCAVESITFDDTAQLLKLRGESMSVATSEKTSMAACIGLEAAQIQDIIDKELLIDSCEIANDNSRHQVVISGLENSVLTISNKIQQLGFRVVRLNVSGAFHSKFMLPAQKIMYNILNVTSISSPKIPVIVNTTAKESIDPDLIKENLVKQITHRVRWKETMDRIFELGITEVIEFGPGKILSNLFKNSGHGYNIRHISSLEDIKNFV